MCSSATRSYHLMFFPDQRFHTPCISATPSDMSADHMAVNKREHGHHGHHCTYPHTCNLPTCNTTRPVMSLTTCNTTCATQPENCTCTAIGCASTCASSYCFRRRSFLACSCTQCTCVVWGLRPRHLHATMRVCPTAHPRRFDGNTASVESHSAAMSPAQHSRRTCRHFSQTHLSRPSQHP